MLAAEAPCRDAIRYVAVERSGALRAELPDEVVAAESLGELVDAHVVFANELLDNLPFALAELTERGWVEVLVHVDESGRLVEGHGEPVADLDLLDALDAGLGARVPVQRAAAAWVRDAVDLVERGSVLIVDYCARTAQLAARPWRDWLRTYRGHERGDDPLVAPGTQDLTSDVAVDQLVALVGEPDSNRSQAEVLAELGIDELVDEGRRQWTERAGIGDLAALRARSRIREADALTDSSGLGAHRVLEWRRDERSPGVS